MQRKRNYGKIKMKVVIKYRREKYGKIKKK
jgi:hypothetical protein